MTTTTTTRFSPTIPNPSEKSYKTDLTMIFGSSMRSTKRVITTPTELQRILTTQYTPTLDAHTRRRLASNGDIESIPLRYFQSPLDTT